MTKKADQEKMLGNPWVPRAELEAVERERDEARADAETWRTRCKKADIERVSLFRQRDEARAAAENAASKDCEVEAPFYENVELKAEVARLRALLDECRTRIADDHDTSEFELDLLARLDAALKEQP